MRALRIVMTKPPREATPRGEAIAIVVEVDVFVLRAPPQSFDKSIVHPSAHSIHAHFHTGRFDRVDVSRTGELGTLIGVGTHRSLSTVGQRLLECRNLLPRCCSIPKPGRSGSTSPSPPPDT